MANKTKLVSDALYEQAQLALRNTGKSGDVGRKLQAIISAKTHGVKAVSEIFGISRKSLMSWIKNFATESENGLHTKTGRGRKRLINSDIEDRVHKILHDKPDITIEQLRQILSDKYNVNAARMTVHRLIKRLGMSYITPRPQHYKSDESAQDDFKKNSETQ